MEKCAIIAEEREKLHAGLKEMGFKCTPSMANFVLAEPPEGAEAERLFLALRARGILLRYFGGGALARYLRITIGSPEQNAALLAALPGAIEEVGRR